MDKCRICLGIRKNLLSIFENGGSASYADMITSVSNIKIGNDDKHCYKICRTCRRKLTEAFEFKNLIERSDAALNKFNNVKKISFSNINDIKIKIEIDSDNQCYTKSEEMNKFFKEGLNEICYNETVIKKVVSSDEKIGRSRKPIPVLEFLQSLKEEPAPDGDDDYNDSLGGSDYGLNTDDDHEYIPPQKLLKNGNKVKRKKTRIEKVKTKKLVGINTEIKPKVCISPVLLKDFKLVYSKPVRKKLSKNEKHVRMEMCPHCGKMSRSLKSHILQHTGERKFKCDQCSKAYFTIYGLKNHMDSHATSKKFKCDKCTACFYTKGSLHSHMNTHTTENKFVCSVCNKAFKRKGALLRHEITHNSANKTVMCEQCNMSFFSKYGLRHHMRVHTGERPFKCEICSQPYSYKHDFNRHCFKKHGVFLKRRSVYVMNEEVLQKERVIMRDLMLKVHGIIKDGEPIINPFDGPQAAQAFEMAVKALETNPDKFM